MANDRCTKLANIIGLFEDIPKDANYESFKGEPWVANMVESHVQGYAQYEKDDIIYYIMSHNNKGYSNGFYMVNTKDSSAKKYDSYDENFNHPGGIQMIGDYLVVAVENSSHNKSHIRLYNLEGLRNKKFEILPEFDIYNDSKGAGYVGITNNEDDKKETFTLAVGDKKKITIYQASAEELLPNAKFEEKFECTLKDDYHGMGLLTDSNDQKVYMIGFRKYQNEDWAELYEIDFKNKTLVKKKSRHFYNKGGLRINEGIHFRWGSGIHIKNDKRLVLIATAKNYVGGKIDTNWWV